MNLATLRRVVWPEQKPLFFVSAAAISLLADVGSFLGYLASPLVLLVIAIALLALFGWFCWPRLKQSTDEGVECRECGAFRLTLYCVVALFILLLVGQGETVSERLSAQLGEVQEDVDVIREDTKVIRGDTEAIRDDTRAIREVTARVEINPNPRTQAERYSNVSIYMSRGESDNAWRDLQAMYAAGPVRMIDAAEQYFRLGLMEMARDDLIARMVRIGRQRRDAPMLMIAARQTETFPEAAALMAEARRFDPNFAPARWDTTVARLNREAQDATRVERHEGVLAEIRDVEAFLAAVQRRRVTEYYFNPQYQGDHEGQARDRLRYLREREGRLRASIEAEQARQARRAGAR